jgi:hypothetical protein
MRHPHYIKHNRGSGTPQHCIFFDTETTGKVIDDDTIEATLNFGYACYVRRIKRGKWSAPKWARFTSPDAFWAFVHQWVKPKRRLYIFAHNLGFDITQVQGFRILQSEGWECTSRILGPKILNLTYRKDGASIRLVDTYNYYPMALKALGDMVGLEKYDFPDEADTPELWDTYCRRDVEIMVAAMKLWWQRITDWGMGNFAVTLASQCMNAYRHRFMGTPIFIDSNDRANEAGRKSYLGGRTEAFFIGKVPERLWCLDINSMYPHIMKTMAVPYRLSTTRTKIEPAALADILDTQCVVADVELEVNEAAIPIRHEGRTTWPVGSFNAVLTTPELRYALDHGMITKIKYAAFYHQAVLFSEYVDFFYLERLKARKEGDKATEGITKLFLTNLYGKFGQNGQKWDIVGQTDDIMPGHFQIWDSEHQELTKYRQFSGLVERLEEKPESRESFPAIAAHITAYARMYLWELMKAAGLENVYYVDTDSLMVNKTGYAALKPRIDPSELGALKVEWKSDHVTLNGLKDYEIDGRLKAKGIRKTAVQTAPGVFTQEQFRGIEGMIRDGDLDRILIKTVSKTLLRKYLKGQVMESGKVFPLRLLR